MQKYEGIVILRPGLPETESEAILGRFEESIAKHGGEITLKDAWGNRKLAYEIDKHSSGDYTLYRFTADNSFVKEADRDLRLDDKVLRHMIVVDEDWAERNRKALAKRAAALEKQEEAEDGH